MAETAVFLISGREYCGVFLGLCLVNRRSMRLILVDSVLVAETAWADSPTAIPLTEFLDSDTNPNSMPWQLTVAETEDPQSKRGTRRGINRR